MREINFDDLPDDPNHPLIKQRVAQKAMDINFDDLPEENTNPDYKKGQELANAAPNQTSLETGLQAAGNVVGGASELVGRGVGAVAKGTFNALPFSAQNYLYDKAQEAMQSDAGKLLTRGVQAYGENLDAYNKENPRMGRNLQAVRDLSPLVPIPGVGKSAAGIVKDVAETGAELGTKGVSKAAEAVTEGVNKLRPSPIPNADEIRAIAKQGYDSAEAIGANLKPEFTNHVIESSRNILPSDPYAKIGRGKTISDDFVKELEEFKDTPMTLANAEALDQNLTNKITATWDANKRGYSEAGQELKSLQDDFRDMIENPKPEWIEKGGEALTAYRDATKAWAASRRMDDVEDIFKRAEMTDNPATAIKTGFRTLAMNKKRMRGYTLEEKNLIEQAAKSGIATDLLRTFGSRLIPIVTGAAGGGLGATAGAAVGSIASRGLSAKMQAGRGEKVAREISKRIPKDIGKLPPREAQKILAGTK